MSTFLSHQKYHLYLQKKVTETKDENLYYRIMKKCFFIFGQTLVVVPIKHSNRTLMFNMSRLILWEI